MTLRRRVPCPRCGSKPLPPPADESTRHEFTCPRCRREAQWSPPRTYRETEPYGFLGLRRRVVDVTIPGRWWILQPGRSIFEEVTR